MWACVCLAHAGDSLQPGERFRVSLLQRVLEAAQMPLPVGQPLVVPLELDKPLLHLELFGEHPLLDL